MHIVIEDKENRRDMVNRQSQQQQVNGPSTSSGMPSLSSLNGQTSSSTSLLKRSKTSDPNRGLPVRAVSKIDSAANSKQALTANTFGNGAEGLTQQSNLAVANIHLP